MYEYYRLNYSACHSQGNTETINQIGTLCQEIIFGSLEDQNVDSGAAADEHEDDRAINWGAPTENLSDSDEDNYDIHLSQAYSPILLNPTAINRTATANQCFDTYTHQNLPADKPSSPVANDNPPAQNKNKSAKSTSGLKITIRPSALRMALLPESPMPALTLAKGGVAGKRKGKGVEKTVLFRSPLTSTRILTPPSTLRSETPKKRASSRLSSVSPNNLFFIINV